MQIRRLKKRREENGRHEGCQGPWILHLCLSAAPSVVLSARTESINHGAGRGKIRRIQGANINMCRRGRCVHLKEGKRVR